MKPIYFMAQVEMLGELAVARVAAECMSIEALLRLAAGGAKWAGCWPRRTTPGTPPQEIAQHAQLLAARASRLVPGAACLHRALASRVWLARRGVSAQIVVGFRKRAALEGHAWLEISTPDGPIVLFRGPADDYRESFREAAA